MKLLPLVTIVWAAAAAAVAQTDLSPAARTIFSTSHRFAVTGLPGVDAITLARWADDVAERVERVLGQRVPFEPGEVVILRSMSGGATSRAGVELAQGYFDGRLQQKLVLVRPAEADQEDLLEGLCALLVNRYLVARQPVERRYAQTAVAPAWLSVGLAQSLFKELRARNAPAVAKLQSEGRLPPVSELLDLQSLPAGRWREKYACGVLVSWLAARPNAHERWPALLQQLAGHGLPRAALQREFLHEPDWAAVEKGWSRWVSQQQQVVFNVGERSASRLEELAAMLVLEPRTFGIVNSNVPTTVAAADLIVRRKEKWVGSLAAAAASKLSLLAVGQPPEFGQAAQQVAAFYGQLVQSSRAHGFLSRGPSAEMLRRSLAAAAQAVAGLRTQMAEQDRYVNAMDRWMDLQQAVDRDAATNAPALPDRLAVEHYLDGVEKTLPAPP